MTTKAFQSTPFIVSTVAFGTAPPNSDQFWNGTTYFLSQYPRLSAQGLAGYGNLLPNTSFNLTENTTIQVGAFEGEFVLPVLSHYNTSASVEAALNPIFANINATYPNQWEFSVNTTTYSSFYEWYKDFNGPDYAGIDLAVGSRLLDEKALTSNLTALRVGLQNSFAPGNGGQINLVSGKGVRDAVPRGGSDAVLPAWRESLVHYSKC